MPLRNSSILLSNILVNLLMSSFNLTTWSHRITVYCEKMDHGMTVFLYLKQLFCQHFVLKCFFDWYDILMVKFLPRKFNWPRISD